MSDDLDLQNTADENNDLEIEETENESGASTNGEGFDQETFVAVKGLIQRLSVQLDEVREKQKEFKQRLKNILENDGQLSEFEEQAKEASKAYKTRKQELTNSTEAKEIKMKVKEYSEEITDLEESLTNSLLSYFQITGTQSFDTPTGEEREFKLKARLLPQKDSK